MSWWSDFKEWIRDVRDNVEYGFNEVKWKAEEIKGGVEEIGNDFHELGEDLADLVHGVVDGEMECASDIRKEADDIISKSNNEYKKKHDEIKKNLLDLDDKREKLFRKKKEVARSINREIHLEVKIPVDIAPLRINKPEEKKFEEVLPVVYKSVLYTLVATKRYIITPSNISKMFLFGGAVNLLTSGERKKNASEYREQAQDYKIKIEGEIAKLNDMGKCIYQIKSIFEVEEKILKILEECLKKKKDLSYANVVKELEILLVEAVLDKNGNGNKKYNTAVEELKFLVEGRYIGKWEKI